MKKSKNNDPLVAKPKALTQQLTSGKGLRSDPIQKKRKRIDDEEDAYIKEKEMKKLLKMSREQQSEVGEGESEEIKTKHPSKKSKLQEEDSDDDDDEDDNKDICDNEDMDDYDGSDVDEEMKSQFDKFFPASLTEQGKLASDVADAISVKQSEIGSQLSEAPDFRQEMSETERKFFMDMAKVMRLLTHGPPPVPFKVIPNFKNWEQLLELTQPDNWSAYAVFAASRNFVHNLTEKKAAKFMNNIVLPRVRDDIKENKMLNRNLFEALMKCTHKMRAFVKGILLPLIKSPDFSTKEAKIIASVLKKATIKMEYTAFLLGEMCTVPYSPSVCILMTELLDKKCAIPVEVIEILVQYFIKFSHTEEELTVLWHQCFLAFAQTYKGDLSDEQRAKLLKILKARPHHLISVEVQRELLSCAAPHDTEMKESV